MDYDIEKAVEIYTNLCEKADARIPNNHNMYTGIYNSEFAILDLVDKTLLTLSTLHSKIAKKQWDDAYVLLEALIIFQDGPGFVWPKRKGEDEGDDLWFDLNPDIRARILGEIVRKKDRKSWWFNTSTGKWDTRFNEDEDKEEEDFMWDLTKWSGRMKEPFFQITGSDDEDAQMS
ncbi:hypothetical protein F5051DRAFT_489424 [Lentinula edodes]|nr:hypothetical protein F5051DRAFT_489424 [Lentinula edodes]